MNAARAKRFSGENHHLLEIRIDLAYFNTNHDTIRVPSPRFLNSIDTGRDEMAAVGM